MDLKKMYASNVFLADERYCSVTIARMFDSVNGTARPSFGDAPSKHVTTISLNKLNEPTPYVITARDE